MEKIIYDNKTIEIIRKEIKRANLKVYPDGSIKVSVPINAKTEQIKKFISAKNLWLNLKIEEVLNQKRKSSAEYVSGEDVYFNGKRYRLKVILSNKTCIKRGKDNYLEMHVSARATTNSKSRLLNEFYKAELEKKIKKYLVKWEDIIGSSAKQYSIRNMKTRWGTFSEKKKSITFNLQLAKKSNDEIQYVIVHELLHSIERKHNDNFYRLLTKYYPKWKKCHYDLNMFL